MNQTKTLPLFLLISFFFFNPLLSEDAQYKSNSPHIIHSVVEGESLWSISRKYDVYIEDILRINNLERFASGVPIIRLDSSLKIPNYSNDYSYKYYCQIDNTSLNLSSEFNTSELFDQCAKVLSKSLNLELINQPIPNQKFWDAFLSDERYPIYFLNRYFDTWFTGVDAYANDEFIRIQKILIESLLKGDKTTLHALEPLDMQDFDWTWSLESILPHAGIDTLEGQIIKLHGKYYSGETFDLIHNFILANWDDTYDSYQIFIDADLSELSDNFQAEYYKYMIESMLENNDLQIHSMMQKAINFLNKRSADGPLISNYILGLYSSLIWQNLTLGNYQLASSISSDLDYRLDIEATTADYLDILFRFDTNNPWDWQHKKFTSDVFVLTSNLVYLYERYYPDTYNPVDLQMYVDDASIFHENGYLEDGLYYQLLQEHSTRLALNNSCDQASSAYQKSRVIFTNYQTEVIKEYVDFNFKMDVADYLPLMSIARCFYEKGELDSATDYLDLSRAMMAMTSNTNAVYDASLNSLGALIAIKNSDSAITIKMYEQVNKDALDLIDNIFELSSVTTPSLFKDYINDYIEIYNFIRTTTPNKNFLHLEPMELIVLHQRVLANKALESLKVESTKRSAQKILKKLEVNKTNIAQLLSSQDVNENHRIQLKRLNAQRHQLTDKLFKGNLKLNNYLNPQLESFDLAINSLDQSEVIFSYILGTTRSMLLINSKQRQHVIHLPYSENHINSLVDTLREGMNFNKDSKFNFEAASELYKILVLPAKIYLNNTSTIYLHGSELESLPFGVLVDNYDKDSTSQYQQFLSAEWLIKDYSFARIFPITNKNQNTEFTHSFMGFGNPSSFQDLDLPKLEGAKEELQFLALASGADIKNLYFDGNATKEVLIDSLNESFERIVFATHSLPAGWQGISSESSLVLSSDKGDFLLTPSEIINFDLETDIVLLSSCNSDQGGANSLYKAFLVAGSNSVIYSNWELETTSAKNITQKLFSNMLFESLPKHLALQKASLEALNNYSNREFSHPAYWGNFSIAYSNL